MKLTDARVWGLWVLLALSGCATGAVQFAPTPLPPDLSPLRYAHPGGVFSIGVPRNWSVYTQNTPSLAAVTFSPPGYDDPVLSIAVINVGEPIAPTALGEYLFEYQTLHRPDLNRYRETDRTALGDGRWRISGVRTQTGGALQQVNTFIESAGSLLAILEVVVPADAALRAELQTAVNTFQLDPSAILLPADLALLGFTRERVLDVVNVGTWLNDSGVFFVTGEVVNNSAETLTAIPVRVSIRDDLGNVLMEATDLAMGHGVAPGGFVPFSLRFGQGKPADATRYVIHAGEGELNRLGRRLYGGGALAWEEESTLTPEGHLYITGELTNNSTTPIDELLALVTVFDDQQTVIGAWFTDLPNDPILPGQTIPFEVRVMELGGNPQNYIVEIQGLGQD